MIRLLSTEEESLNNKVNDVTITSKATWLRIL